MSAPGRAQAPRLERSRAHANVEPWGPLSHDRQYVRATAPHQAERAADGPVAPRGHRPRSSGLRQLVTLMGEIQWGYDFSYYWTAARQLLDGGADLLRGAAGRSVRPAGPAGLPLPATACGRGDPAGLAVQRSQGGSLGLARPRCRDPDGLRAGALAGRAARRSLQAPVRPRALAAPCRRLRVPARARRACARERAPAAARAADARLARHSARRPAGASGSRGSPSAFRRS